MKSILKWLLLNVSIVVLSATIAADDRDGTNEYVEADAFLNATNLRPGGAGYFTISFQPKEGIFITTDPPFRLVLDTLKDVVTLRKLEFTKTESNYVDTERPVRQHFEIPKAIPPGSYRLRGTLVYFYCSDEKGWCSGFRQPIELTLTVLR